MAVLAMTVALPALAEKDVPRSFSLSTSRTFAPGESVKVQLLARNVPALEFRVYKVRDAEKFFSSLEDLHSFGVKPYSPQEQIDKKTFLEKMHDFKAHLWWLVRRFFRGQFTDEARDSFRERQGKLGKRSQVVGASEFARIPLLNESQLVARWKLITPPTIVSETHQLPIDGLKAGVYLIEATDGTYKAYTVAIVTQIAIVERAKDGVAQLYVADRKTGAPVADAASSLWTGHRMESAARTGTDGMATLRITTARVRSGEEPENVWLLARRGEDVALVTPYGYNFGSQPQTMSSYVYTDRPVYRPGHTVHIRAVVRQKKDDALELPIERTLHLKVTDAAQKTVLEKDEPVSAHGVVSDDVTLANDAALGYYTINLTRESDSAGAGYGSFYVEEYKKPEYQVTVKATALRVLQGSPIQATIEARYFFGEPVAGAKVKYVVHTSTHWWWDSGDEDESDADGQDESDYSGYGESEQSEQTGTLDANGRLTVSLSTTEDGKHNDVDYRIEARVTDDANREVSGHQTVLATYGSFRLIAEPTSYVFRPGQPAKVKVTAQDYDSKPVETDVKVTVSLRKWDSSTHESSRTEVATAKARTGADGTALVDLPLTGSGDFEVLAQAETPEHRTVEGRAWVWVWNNAGEWYNENTQAQIVADKKSYQVGDTAHLLLVTGLKESWAVVSAEGESVQWRQVVHAIGETAAFDVPITVKAQPNLVVTALIVHEDQVITAQKSLKVPTTERTLTVTATPDKQKYLPGEQGTFDVLARDAQGHPVEADLSFGEVDEALYSVRPDTTGDIVAAFYPQRSVYLNPESSFSFYFYGEAGLKSPLLAQAAGAGLFHPRMAQVKPGSDLVMPKVRKAFPDTAYWNPNVHTGPDGHARVSFNFPDALTTWRTTIRAMTDDGKAGGVVTRVLVRKNLIVRLAAPRFFRVGDETVLRVIAHNYLESAKEVTFALNATGVQTMSGQQQKVAVPAKGEAFAEWRVKASATGQAVLTAKALTNEESDALEMTLPVEPFGVKQRAAGVGVVFSGAGENKWKYGYPQSADGRSRAMTVTVAPSVAGTVFDALDYLTGYPWGCTEQTMSRFLPDLIVARAVDTLKVKSPIDRRLLNDMMDAGIERLKGFEHEDGGWGWWKDDESQVFMTAYVVAGLEQARQAGVRVPFDMIWNGRKWLQTALEQHKNMVPDLRAYVLYAMATGEDGPSDMSRTVKEAMDRAWNERSELSDEGLALLGLALHAAQDARAHEAATLLEKKAKTQGNEAWWQTNYDSLMGYWFDASPEATAWALKLMIAEDKSSGLMPKAAEWLAHHRDGGYWYSTEQTAMVINGLTDYLAVSGELQNSSDVEVLVNGVSVGKRHFDAADAFGPPWKLRLTAAQLGADGEVAIRKSGNGITYWSAENSWYTADRRQFQQGQVGLNITRDYYLLQKRQDKPTDAITYDLQPLRGPVHVGDIVAVRLAVAGSQWRYLMAEDPIPAGTEFLANSGLYKLNNKPEWWADWFTRKEFHDDRAAFFNTDFNGRREYVYLLKVVNAGRFQISPADAGPMYQTNVQTTSDAAALEVQP